MTRQPEIPELPEELTPEWLSNALDSTIAGIKLEVLGQGQGFLGDVIRLSIDSPGGSLPATLIAKLPKKANRTMGEMLGVYEREVLFFQELGDKVPVRTPTIYFSHYDPDAGSARQKEILRVFDALPKFLIPVIGLFGKTVAGAKNRRYLILMEDLADYQPGDQFAGADGEACARVLEQFAQAHKAYWQAPELDDQFWLLPMDIDARMRQGMFRQSVGQFLEEADDTLSPFITWLADHHAELTRTLTSEAPTTLVHCDLRLDNICFDSERCAFLDWQLTRSGPAAYDVAYFLSSALNVDTSADEEDEILHRYHRALDPVDYPYDRFHRDYQRSLLLSLTAVMPSPDINIDAGRGQEMMSRWRDRLNARLQRVDVSTLL